MLPDTLQVSVPMLIPACPAAVAAASATKAAATIPRFANPARSPMTSLHPSSRSTQICTEPLHPLAGVLERGGGSGIADAETGRHAEGRAMDHGNALGDRKSVV